jgi:hypothetical protein
MRSDRDEVIRVGIRLVLVAFAVGLLLIALSGDALSHEVPVSVSEAAEVLVSHAPLSSEARVDEAEQLLGEAKQERLARTGSAVLDLLWRGVSLGSPRRILKSGRRVARELREWSIRSPAEDRALSLLESDVIAGDTRGRELYLYLRSREDDQRITRWLDEAEEALDEGKLGSARRRLDWVAALRPEEPELEPLRDALSEAAPRTTVLAETHPIAQIEAWEVPLAAALLADQYATVLAFEGERDDVDLAQAAALYLSGDRGGAVTSLEQLEERDGAPASLAQAWLADERFHPEAALASSERNFRVRKALGWLGGDRLEENGLSLSRDGYKAWQAALSPLNLVVSLPARLITRRRPQAAGVRDAATSYLDRVPFGPRAAAANAWLDADGPARRSDRAFDDGHFVLPRAVTSYRRVNALRLLVTPAGLDVINRDRFARLGIDVTTETPLFLIPVSGEVSSAAITLSPDTALRLAAGLARGLETGALMGVESERVALLEGLRRLDVSLRSGASLVVEPWQRDIPTARSALGKALLEGESPAQLRQLRVARSRDSVEVERELFGRSVECPEATLCIDRARAHEGSLYARVDDDGGMRLGLNGSVANARLALEIGESGPRASVVLPIGRWLGVGRWLPAEFHLDLGLDGLEARPKLGRPHRGRSYTLAGR